MKKITPMKKLAPILDDIKLQLQNSFDIITLNKSKPKYNPTEFQYGKGVESDFIIIFSYRPLKKLKDNLSFAFSFDYLERDENKELIQVTIKYGKEEKDIFSSTELDFLTFKNQLKMLNKELKLMNHTDIHMNVIEKIKTIFNIHPQSHDKQLIDFWKNLQNELILKRKELGLEELEKNLETSKNEYLSCLTKIAQKIEQSEEQKKVRELEKALLIAQKNLELFKQKIEKQYNKENLSLEGKQRDRLVKEAKNKLKTYEEEQIKSLSNINQKKILKIK